MEYIACVIFIIDIITITMYQLGFPDGASVKEIAYQCRRHKRHGFKPWVGEILWMRAWPFTPVFLPGESHGQRSLVGYIPQCYKEMDMNETTQQQLFYFPPEISTQRFHSAPQGLHRMQHLYCWEDKVRSEVQGSLFPQKLVKREKAIFIYTT